MEFKALCLLLNYFNIRYRRSYRIYNRRILTQRGESSMGARAVVQAPNPASFDQGLQYSGEDDVRWVALCLHGMRLSLREFFSSKSRFRDQ